MAARCATSTADALVGIDPHTFDVVTGLVEHVFERSIGWAENSAHGHSGTAGARIVDEGNKPLFRHQPAYQRDRDQAIAMYAFRRSNSSISRTMLVSTTRLPRAFMKILCLSSGLGAGPAKLTPFE
jgi:hypothetical protein